MAVAVAAESGIVRRDRKDFPPFEESWKIYIHYFSL
jgi:hypothetical protein